MAHIHEKIDFTATVFVVYNDTVLLRLHEKYHEWYGVGGHIELDEDANTAAIREVKEEVGLDATLVPPPSWANYAGDKESEHELVPPVFLNIHYVGGGPHQHHDFVFVATSETDTVVPEHPDDKWLWLTEAELMAHPDISNRNKHYGLTALRIVRTNLG